MELIALYIKDFQGIKNQLVPLNSKYDITIGKNNHFNIQKAKIADTKYPIENFQSFIMLFGKNASGKTRILKLIHYLLRLDPSINSTNGYLIFLDDRDAIIKGENNLNKIKFSSHIKSKRTMNEEDTYYNLADFYPTSTPTPFNNFNLNDRFELPTWVTDFLTNDAKKLPFRTDIYQYISPIEIDNQLIEDIKINVDDNLEINRILNNNYLSIHLNKDKHLKKSFVITKQEIADKLLNLLDKSTSNALKKENSKILKNEIITKFIKVELIKSYNQSFDKKLVLLLFSDLLNKNGDYNVFLDFLRDIHFEASKLDQFSKLANIEKLDNSFSPDILIRKVLDLENLLENLSRENKIFFALNEQFKTKELDLFLKAIRQYDIKLKSIANLSTGQYQLTFMLASLFKAMKETKNNKRIIFLSDEIDLFLHPEWQKQILNLITKTIPLTTQKKVSIIFTSHSPIIISDLNENNIVYLKNEETKALAIKDYSKGIFFKDIDLIFRDSFTLNSSKGEITTSYLLSKINDASSEDKEEVYKIINNIEDPAIKLLLKNKIKKKLLFKDI